jgi:hypothetical protein
MPPRLLPDVPLPAYTFVPGRTPHPISDPVGHSFGAASPPPPLPPDPERWRECLVHLHGLDLFNHGFFWESHVEWESLWLACGRKGEAADFLKGLIQLAAAGVKHLEGRLDGVRSHARRAAELFRTTARRRERFLGLRLADLTATAEKVDRFGWPATPPLLVSTDDQGIEP